MPMIIRSNVSNLDIAPIFLLPGICHVEGHKAAERHPNLQAFLGHIAKIIH